MFVAVMIGDHYCRQDEVAPSLYGLKQAKGDTADVSARERSVGGTEKAGLQRSAKTMKSLTYSALTGVTQLL